MVREVSGFVQRHGLWDALIVIALVGFFWRGPDFVREIAKGWVSVIRAKSGADAARKVQGLLSEELELRTGKQGLKGRDARTKK